MTEKEPKIEGERELSKKQKILREIKIIFIILITVLSFRSVFFQPFRIPSGSMIPTLMIGDFVLVNMFAYGFKVPFSDMTWPIARDPIYLLGEKKPQRGDVIVFKYPLEPRVNYIKRVIAIEGDVVEIRNKRVYLNGEPIPVTSIDGTKIMEDMDHSFKAGNYEFYRAQIGETEHIVQLNLNDFHQTDLSPRTVPSGHYFVLGDNRDHSADSRFWGFVPHENVRGRASLVWFSMSLPFGDNTFKFRPWRIGTIIR